MGWLWLARGRRRPAAVVLVNDREGGSCPTAYATVARAARRSRAPLRPRMWKPALRRMPADILARRMAPDLPRRREYGLDQSSNVVSCSIAILCGTHPRKENGTLPFD